VDVKPALVWKSRIVNFKRLPAHYPVSYGSTWQSDHPVNIATIPVGYGDGYFRLLSNKGRVIVNGKSYPQVGRVCMDQLMINLEDDAAQIGAEVTLLGESFTADDLAGLIGTISYEVLTNIGARVPRVYVG
jgi:alanine racemase